MRYAENKLKLECIGIERLLVDADIFKYSRRKHSIRIDQMGYEDVSIGIKIA